MIEPKEGMRVVVLNLDRKFLGCGTVIKVQPLIVKETQKLVTNYFPTIRLDSGEELNGLECWWHELK